LKGRKARNVVALRGLFIDQDNGESPPFLVEPSLVVQCDRGPHVYWLLKPGEDIERFSSAQKALIHHFNSDERVHDLPRVMRLPGFYHMKKLGNPLLVTIREIQSDRKYCIDEILAAHPHVLSPPDSKTPTGKSSLSVHTQRKKSGRLDVGEGRDTALCEYVGKLRRRELNQDRAW